jgi:radical SAM enzyme (TIGR01210 family)
LLIKVYIQQSDEYLNMENTWVYYHMMTLADFSRQLKQGYQPREQNPTKPVRYWHEQDRLDDDIVDAFVIILRTEGCSWARASGCTMCGYFNDSLWKPLSPSDLLTQFTTAMKSYHNEPLVKIFTSGSFLDPQEIPLHVQQNILKKLAKTTKKISVESRPEYITEKTLSSLRSLLDGITLELGIGLETTNDDLRAKAINKGFTFQDYATAVTTAKKHSCSIKTYLLVKPPFITEQAAIDDCIQSIQQIRDLTDIISLNPTNVQRRTVVEYLWKRQHYRPPWLWSIMTILQQGKTLAPRVYLKCDIAGGGSSRGAHNCKLCNTRFLQSIAEFSLSQDISLLDGLSCSCHDTWLDHLELEDLGFGSLTDIERMDRYAQAYC